MIDIVRAPVLGCIPHGFLGRSGGVSTGAMASLNCGRGSQDDPADVERNRARAVNAVAPGKTLVSVHQIHSAHCASYDGDWTEDARPQADAIVTAQRGVALAIVTADCAPVLLADVEAGVVGVAHAGWKGALAGITDATVAAMQRIGARRDRIAAALGPCIGRGSYEVSDSFARPFLRDDAANERFFASGRADHAHFDLEAYVAHRLTAAGCQRVWAAGLDTCVLEARFFSYRRATLAGEPSYGRNIAMIALP